jgi:tetratricopeptide (TPR) repeat protein
MRLLAAVLVGLGLMILAPAWAQPSSVAQHFEAASEAYAEGQYEDAVEKYRSILDAGHESAALYHNLGNAYVRLDRTGPAVWAYERGRRLRPGDPRLQHNLEYVRRRAELPRRGGASGGLAALVVGWSPLLLFGIGMLALCAGGVGHVIWSGPDWADAWRAPAAWGTAGAGVLLVAVALATSYVQAQGRRAVVMEEAVPLRAAPADTAAADTTLRAGRLVNPEAERDGWTHVRLRDRTEGWIAPGAVAEI